MPYLTWLADACRDTGYPVVEVPGWRTRDVLDDEGRPKPMTAGHGVVGHWTAGPDSWETHSNTPSLNTIINGRTGLRGPLAQIYTAFDGTLYVVAAGLCNHAGVSGWLGETGLNDTFVGNEVESPGDFSYTPEQLDVTPRLHAALLRRMDRTADWSCAHFECALPAGRKPDGPARDMNAFRRTVAGYLADPSTIRKPLVAADPLEEIMALYDSTKDFEAGLTRAFLAALDQRLPRMVMALDGRGNSVFNGDMVAKTPPAVLAELQKISANTEPTEPPPPAEPPAPEA